LFGKENSVTDIRPTTGKRREEKKRERKSAKALITLETAKSKISRP
jgi:hypothetical protein